MFTRFARSISQVLIEGGYKWALKTLENAAQTAKSIGRAKLSGTGANATKTLSAAPPAITI